MAAVLRTRERSMLTSTEVWREGKLGWALHIKPVFLSHNLDYVIPLSPSNFPGTIRDYGDMPHTLCVCGAAVRRRGGR
eukprot:1967599-Prymnesium_polylepis.1